MKRKLLSVIAVIMMILLLLPIITSCSCTLTPGQNDTETDTETGDDTGKDTGKDTGEESGEDINPITPDTSEAKSAPSLRWLRITKISSDSITLKVNTIGENIEFDVRYSDSEITDENFDSATKADPQVISGEGYARITVKGITADAENKHYIAVRAKSGGASTKVECVRAGGLEIIPVNYGEVNAVYAGQVNRDFASKLFDEQDLSDPLNKKGTIPSSGYSLTYKDKTIKDAVYNPAEEHANIVFKPVIDLEYKTYVECIYVYYGQNAYPITVRTSDKTVSYDKPEEWTASSETVTDTKPNSWNRIDIGKEVRYILLEYKNGEIPTEVLVYGYYTAEGDIVTTTKAHGLPTVGEMMGMCALVNCDVAKLMPAGVVREYHNVGWSYSYQSFPTSFVTFASPHGLTDNHYNTWVDNYLNVVPCLQWKAGDKDEVAHVYDPSTGKLKTDIASYSEKFDPETYIGYAAFVFNYAARYGSNASDALAKVIEKRTSLDDAKVGTECITWIELGNEPNGEDASGYNAYQLAALTSAAYDGHVKTVGSKYFRDSEYFFGGKNADPNIKLAMAGVAGIQNVMVGTMVYWMKANRSDGSVAMDAFNVHTYFPRTFVMNGQNITVGISPEEFGLADAMSKLVNFRDKYYPEKEVWLTEFGWDTAQSYVAPTAAHAYGEYTGRQVQAMWLVRAYLILSAIGVDKATMFTGEPDGVSEDTNVGKYSTCGLIARDGTKKDSFFYVYTLKNTLGGYTFVREIDAGTPDVWIYEYQNADGDIAYALWCPTSDGTKVNNFKLNINANGATLVENVNGATEGKKTELDVVDKTVTVNVSENPIYILVK